MKNGIVTKWSFITLLYLVLLTGCGSSEYIPPVELTTVPPTAPATLPEIIDALSVYTAEVRITAAYAVPKFGEDAVVALPALTENLKHRNSKVREAASFALGRLGPNAGRSVPELIEVLQNDDVVNVRISVTDALGRIGDPSAIPALVSILYEEETLGPTPTPISCEYIDGAKVCDYGTNATDWWRTNEKLAVKSAEAISAITKIDFQNIDSSDVSDQSGEGIPLIVIATREWWEKEGQYQKWSQP